MFIDIQQNTDDWLDLRAGKVTGSAVSKIMAKDGNAFGEPAKKYAVELAVERLRGCRIEGERYTSKHMEAGHIEEPIARDMYQEITGNVVTNGGFFDNGKSGSSPDGCILFENGGIEIKSVTPAVHYKTIMRNAVDPAYKHQVTFNIRETAWDFIDFVSFCEQFYEPKQLCIVRILRSNIQNELAQMDKRINEFELLISEITNNISGVIELVIKNNKLSSQKSVESKPSQETLEEKLHHQECEREASFEHSISNSEIYGYGKPDCDYLRTQMGIILTNMDNYTKDELRTAFTRLADAV